MKPDSPCLADEIAEPRPDMNIKVAAFTVSEKSSNTKRIKTVGRVSIKGAKYLNAWPDTILKMPGYKR